MLALDLEDAESPSDLPRSLLVLTRSALNGVDVGSGAVLWSQVVPAFRSCDILRRRHLYYRLDDRLAPSIGLSAFHSSRPP